MTKPFAALAFLSLAIFACHNSTDRPVSVRADTEGTNMAGQQKELQNAFPALYQFFSRQDSSFSPGHFEVAGTDTLPAAEVLPVTDDLKEYMPYLVYNKDSSYAVDLYSYNIILSHENGTTIGEASGPDTEVGLVDLKQKTRRRIYFGGASSGVLDASWIQPDIMLLFTGQRIIGHGFQPELVQYDVRHHTTTRYIYPDTLRADASGFNDSRLTIE